MASKVALTSVLHPMSKKEPLLDWDTEFVDLEECSPSYQQSFRDAWKAIEHKSERRLKDSIENMKNNATDKTKFLDACYLQFELSLSQRKRTSYYMSLLAHAAVHGQKSMVEELLSNGANTQSGNCLSGSPLTQMLVYALHHNCPEVVDGEIVQLLIDTSLDINVFYFIYQDGPNAGYGACSPIELAMDIKRIDIAQLMVMKGANPIHPSLERVDGVLQLLEEYYEFGTNHFISWLLHHHLLSHELPQFIKTIFELDIFNKGGMRMFNDVGRHPAHALLTCGNEEVVRQLLNKRHSLLTVKDATQRTALLIATQRGDLESVEILLKFYGHDERQDMALGLLAAARKGYVKIVRHFIGDDLELMIENLPNGKTVLNQAKEEGLACLFEVLLHDFPFVYKMLTKTCDEDGNTLVHHAALTGNSKLFKVFFPLQPMMTDEGRAEGDFSLQRRISSEHARTMFEALTLVNRGKTPLHLAIDKDQLCILRTLQERIVERDSHPGAEENKEKNAWEEFWRKWGPRLFIYACSYGSLDAVKFFIEMECPLYSCDKDETPPSAAARNGRDGTLQYLLNGCKYNIHTVSKHSPLLLAAEKGHASCVSILLKKEVDIKQSKNGYNCLMIAAERKHRGTVMAILSDKQGFEALRWKKESVTPMRMLIEHLPDTAEWVLNKCVLEGHRLRESDKMSDGVDGSDDKDDTDEPESSKADHHVSEDSIDGDVDLISKESDDQYPLLHEFEFIEDFKPSAPKKGRDETDIGGNVDETADRNWQPDDCRSSNHTMKLMVKYNRKNLLDHVLVKRLISYKWWRVGLPFLLVSYGFHFIFLVLLTTFALVIPRPRPACFGTESGRNVTGSNENGTGITCEGAGVTETQKGFLIFAAVIVILTCIFYLLLEVYQVYRRGPRKYFTSILNYFQSITYLCVIVFVFPAGHVCWCYPSWKWQIGALAIFLAWMNNFVLLKDIPHIGKPITMLFNVYVNFMLLVYLPILLILTFAFPFYMLFIITLEEDAETERLFPTPFHAMWDVILQTAGGPDSQYFTVSLSHKIMVYGLFIIFIIAVPVLFNNFLIGVAVGETEEERKKAKLSIIKSKIEYIFECEDTIPFFRKFSYASKPPGALEIHAHVLELLEHQNKSFLEEFQLEGEVQSRSMEMERLQNGLLEATKLLGVLEEEVKQCRKDLARIN